MDKKAQFESMMNIFIIVIVLIIVVVIAGFIISNIGKKTEESQAGINCINMLFTVKEAANGSSSIKIERGNDKEELIEVRILIDGKQKGSYKIDSANAFNAQETVVIILNDALSSGQEIEIIPVLKQGACQKISGYKVSA